MLESGSPTEDQDRNSALKSDQIHKMDEDPNQAGHKARKMGTENVRHCGRAPTHCQRPLVEIMKRWMLRTTFERPLTPRLSMNRNTTMLVTSTAHLSQLGLRST
jgi:hypothetical protein